jgi:hypothetical protein
VDTFLNPVYELKFNGVSVLKIWKNDLSHSKTQWRKNELLYTGALEKKQENNTYTLAMSVPTLLSEVALELSNNALCKNITPIFVQTSLNGVSWNSEKDAIPSLQKYKQSNLANNRINYDFAGVEAKYIRMVSGNGLGCLMNSKVSIKILE